MDPISAHTWGSALLVVGLAWLAATGAMRGVRVAASRRLLRDVERSGARSNPPAKGRGWGVRGSGALILLWWIFAPIGAVMGWALAGPMGLVVGGGAGAAIPYIRVRRTKQKRVQAMEGDLADLAGTTALALHSGLSVSQAFEFAGAELRGPARGLFDQFVSEQRLGVTFESALERFGASFGTDDAELFVLVMSVHAKSGGDLAGALEEVSSTIRHRIAVRRELRAASTQGRVSGAILGALPIAFFLVLSATSHRQLGPVYRSAPGIAMVSGGLAMEALAYLWIRRLLRIEV